MLLLLLCCCLGLLLWDPCLAAGYVSHTDCTLDDKDADVDQGSGSDDGVGSDSGNADAALEEGGDQRQRRVPKPRRHDPDELAPGDVFFDTSPETEPRQKRASKKEQEAAAVLAGLSSYSNPLDSGSSDDNDLASDDVSTGTSPVKGEDTCIWQVWQRCSLCPACSALRVRHVCERDRQCVKT